MGATRGRSLAFDNSRIAYFIVAIWLGALINATWASAAVGQEVQGPAGILPQPFSMTFTAKRQSLPEPFSMTFTAKRQSLPDVEVATSRVSEEQATSDQTESAAVPGSWSGTLDDAALAQEVVRFNGKPGRQLEDYSAGSLSVLIDRDVGTIEIMGEPQCTVQTRVDTSDGQDHVRVQTVTVYSTKGPQPLRNMFDVQLIVTKTTTNKKGQAIGAQGITTMVRQARITDADETGARFLTIYNGQPSVEDVPWRLVAKFK